MEWLEQNLQQEPLSLNPARVDLAQFSELEPELPDATTEADLPMPNVDAANGLAGSDANHTGTESIDLPIDSDAMGRDSFSPSHENSPDGPFCQTDEALFYSTNSGFRRGFWYTQSEFVMLQRSQIQDLLFAIDNTTANTAFGDDMSIGDTTFSYEPGIRFRIGKLLGQDVTNRDQALEIGFLGFFTHSGNASVASDFGQVNTVLGPGLPVLTGARADVPVAGFFNADLQTIDYQADFDSFEVNYRILGRPLRDRLALQPSGVWVRHATPSRIKSGLVGFRYIRLNDFLQYRSFFPDPTLDAGDYLLRVHNDMFGVHLGGSVAESYSNWSWELNYKVGSLINFVDRNTAVNTITAGVADQRSQSIDQENLAVVVEAGIHTTYQIQKNCLARIGYDFMYLTGISEASSNIDLASGFPMLDMGGDALFHGLSVGLEIYW